MEEVGFIPPIHPLGGDQDVLVSLFGSWMWIIFVVLFSWLNLHLPLQLDLGTPSFPPRLLNTVARRQAAVIADLDVFLASWLRADAWRCTSSEHLAWAFGICTWDLFTWLLSHEHCFYVDSQLHELKQLFFVWSLIFLQDIETVFFYLYMNAFYKSFYTKDWSLKGTIWHWHV